MPANGDITCVARKIVLWRYSCTKVPIVAGVATDASYPHCTSILKYGSVKGVAKTTNLTL